MWESYRVAACKFTLLLAASLVLVLAPLIVQTSGQRSLFFGSAVLVVLLFGVLATVRHRKALILALVLGGLAAVAQVTSFVYGAGHYPQLRLAVFAVFLSFVALVIIRDVLRAEAVTWDKIMGAVCVYLLIGVTWGLLYAWVEVRDPQAFGGTGHPAAGYPGEPMVYYSFVTLTTLGYGDIVPLSQTARSLSWMEAAFGQIYLVVLVARLVSLHLTHSAGRGTT